MKRFLILAIAILGFAANMQAQQIIPTGSFSARGANPYYTSLDTFTNTGADTFTQAVPNRWVSVSWQLNLIKISGTTTGNYATLYGSVDGTNYVSLYVDSMGAASNSFIHTITGNPYTKYRWIITGAGTQSSSARAYLLIR